MSSGERIRGFIALDVAAEIRAALCRLQEELARIKTDVRWVRPEGLHVTLKFLGWVEAERLERVRESLAQAAGTRPAMHVRVRGLGAFPSMRRPRVLWAGLQGDGLVELAADVDTAVSRLGFEAEKRAFTPHLTIGRVDGMRGWERLEERLKQHWDDDFGSCAIDAVTVYRSTLRPDGAVYTPLWTIPLSKHKGEPQV